MNRRTFITSSALLAAAGTALPSNLLARPAASEATPLDNIRNYKPSMQYRPMGQTGVLVSALSFGMMRPPFLPSGEPDEATFQTMVRHAIDNGLNYIDTSHVYSKGKSQGITGRILQNGYREKVWLATKFPWWQMEKAGDFDRILNQQLEELQTDAIDFYLLHAITIDGWNGAITRFNIPHLIEKAKEQGKIKHMGFSLHAPSPIFKKVLQYTPHWEFCQLQMNYLDVEYEAGLVGIKQAYDRGMGVIAMEPLRGGFLASLPPKAKAILETSPQKYHDVAWAFNYLWDMPEISTVLSGMSAMPHVIDNLTYAKHAAVEMMRPEERKILAQMIQHLRTDYNAVPCTGCNYCRLACPEEVAVAQLMIPWNQYKWNGNMEPAKRRIEFVHGGRYGNGVPACTQCNKCLPACPQGINIPGVLQEIKTTMKI